MSEKERMSNALFSAGKGDLVDVKFFRGSRTSITEEEFCREAANAFESVNSGKVQPVEHLDRGKLKPRSVEEFLAG